MLAVLFHRLTASGVDGEKAGYAVAKSERKREAEAAHFRFWGKWNGALHLLRGNPTTQRGGEPE